MTSLTSLTTVPSLDTSGRRDLSNLPSFSSLRRVSCAGGSSYAALCGLPRSPQKACGAERAAASAREFPRGCYRHEAGLPPPRHFQAYLGAFPVLPATHIAVGRALAASGCSGPDSCASLPISSTAYRAQCEHNSSNLSSTPVATMSDLTIKYAA